MKFGIKAIKWEEEQVALFVRAWIEIRDVGHMIGDLVRRSLRESVD